MFEIRPREEGLGLILRPWQQAVFRYLWEQRELNKGIYAGEKSVTIWQEVNKILEPESISRASIINFCQALAKNHYLDAYETTGKGGTVTFYKPSHTSRDEQTFMETVINWAFSAIETQYPKPVQNVFHDFYGVK